MQKFKVLWLPLFAFVAFAGLHFSSCQRDADQSQVKPLSDVPVGERVCVNNDWCSWVVTATTDCTIELCGDIYNQTGGCSGGCGTLSDDHSITVSLTANTPHTFCVRDIGSVCVRNPSTGTHTINVDVKVAGTAPINVNIPVGESQCFHSDDQCSATMSGCF